MSSPTRPPARDRVQGAVRRAGAAVRDLRDADGADLRGGEPRVPFAGQQLLLRLVTPLATVAFLLVTLLHGHVASLFTGPAIALALGAALLPDSAIATFLLLDLALIWALAVPDPLTPWAVPAGLLALAVHLATTLAAVAPPSGRLPASLVRAWVLRSAGLAATVPATWLALRLVAARPPDPAGWLFAVGLLVVLGWAAVLTVRFESAADEGAD
jgi:hypothetical protein